MSMFGVNFGRKILMFIINKKCIVALSEFIFIVIDSCLGLLVARLNLHFLWKVQCQSWVIVTWV